METVPDITRLLTSTGRCTGCSSCAASCPKRCITLIENAEGFYELQIDSKNCIHCGVCAKSCPALSATFLPAKLTKPECFCAWAKPEIVSKSTSGGVFTPLAESVLANNGCVAGASYSDDFRRVEHILVENSDDLGKLRSSKYVQSHLNNCFEQIQKHLNNNRQVLFSGTPCQVAGLYAFLKKDAPNLLTIDLVCNSAPSPKVWRMYLNEITGNGHVTRVNIREINWITPDFVLEHSGGKIVERNSLANNIYCRGFLQRLYIKKCCDWCLYGTTPRQGDLSIGDFWGVT